MFNSDNFNEINYLNFDADFSIDLGDKIKIILGPNGTGKSTLYKNIKSRHNDYAFIDYEEVEESVIGQKNNIIIGASIVELNNKLSEKQTLIDDIDIRGNLKKFSITNTANAKAISNNMEVLRKNHEEAILKFSDEHLNLIFDMPEDDQIFFQKNAKSFLDLNEIKTQVDDLKNNYKKHILEEIDIFLDNDEVVCPVCGRINDEPIKVIIARKLAEIEKLEEKIVEDYQLSHSGMSPSKILENVNNIKNIIVDNGISISNIENYLLCGGNSDKAKIILKSKQQLIDLNAKILELEKEKDEFYNNLKSHKEDVNSVFLLQFDVREDDIIFDDVQKLINIKLPRNVDTYSTGEINLMTFVICILGFVSSDKSYLVIDDPLSSYDIPNQYRIIYEIASAKKDNKHILIFTHNIDTINIANSQYSSAFEYEIMEKRKNTLYLNSVGYTASANVLSLTELLNHIEITYPHLNYLKLLLAKDEWEDTSDNHLIFHYDCPFNIDIDGINYSNDYLVNLIENFDDKTFQNSSYLNNTADKIIYCAAIRAWIEKQFYVNLSGDTGLQRKQFGDKIRYVFGGNRWNGSSRVTKEYLMSKKVMLNQHVHTESQKMPFYYSLNLTFDDITKEILDIKNHFLTI